MRWKLDRAIKIMDPRIHVAKSLGLKDQRIQAMSVKKMSRQRANVDVASGICPGL